MIAALPSYDEQANKLLLATAYSRARTAALE
jgi:hypothetical protein